MASQACPTCSTELPVDPRYVTWCHACGWNLRAPDAPTGDGRLDRIAASVGRRLGERMADRFAASDELAPRLTAAKVAAYAIAAAVHTFVLALVVTGVWLLVAGPGPVAKVGGALLLGLAYLMRPRLGRRPKEGVVDRESAPGLYALVDEIARSLDTAAADTVVVNADYNASWSVVGLRRERVLTLGLPLLAVLDRDERVALIAHELAHARNGDATRGLVVGSAIEGLWELYTTFVPPSDQHTFSELELAEVVVRPVLWLLGQPFRLLLLLELHLLLHDGRRAEYLADRLAARSAGAAAVIDLHEKLLLATVATTAVHRYAIGSSSDGADVFEAMRAAVGGVPERERERRRRLARLEETRLGASHPPTGKRIEMLERRAATDAIVRLDEARAATIDDELRSVRPELSRQVVEEYRDAVSA